MYFLWRSVTICWQCRQKILLRHMNNNIVYLIICNVDVIGTSNLIYAGFYDLRARTYMYCRATHPHVYYGMYRMHISVIVMLYCRLNTVSSACNWSQRQRIIQCLVPLFIQMSPRILSQSLYTCPIHYIRIGMIFTVKISFILFTK